MLARGGGPGGWYDPEVPVLELEYPCVLNFLSGPVFYNLEL